MPTHADPASRAFQRSQEAYDVVGFKRTVEPGVEDIGVSTENTFSSGFCYDGGLLGLEDKTVDGAYRMSHSWALDHVPASRAVAGLRRLHQHLKDNGWEVTSCREGAKGKMWDLFVQRNDGAEGMSFTWSRTGSTSPAAPPCPAPTTPSGRTATSAPPGTTRGHPPSGPHSGTGAVTGNVCPEGASSGACGRKAAGSPWMGSPLLERS
ncbi:hypothetical protein [Streptomyces atratus]|uniref:hypothetical protein n=1 Tax=Streptomyces atratus TaxID=1893 RepID=UPI0033CA835F